MKTLCTSCVLTSEIGYFWPKNSYAFEKMRKVAVFCVAENRHICVTGPKT